MPVKVAKKITVSFNIEERKKGVRFARGKEKRVSGTFFLAIGNGAASLTVSAASEVREVELDLVPSFVESHGHRADERLHARRGLIIGRAEPAAHVLVIQHLNFEREILLQVLDDHNQERQLDPQSLLRITRAGDVDGRNLHISKVGEVESASSSQHNISVRSKQGEASLRFKNKT